MDKRVGKFGIHTYKPPDCMSTLFDWRIFFVYPGACRSTHCFLLAVTAAVASFVHCAVLSVSELLTTDTMR